MQASPGKPEEMRDPRYGSAAEVMALPVPKLVALLRDTSATVYAKAKACQRLSVTGDRTAVAALAALLGDPALSHYARVALEPLPDPAADEALRKALTSVQGRLLVGVIASVAHRRDAKAIPLLAKLQRSPDPEVARAANAALARVRPPR
jgi:HEAT repeat protein